MELLDNKAVISPAVGHPAVFTVFYTFVRVGEITAAVLAEGVEGAVAEKAVEVLFLYALVAGEAFAFPVAVKGVVLVLPVGLSVIHNETSFCESFFEIIPHCRRRVNLENGCNFLLQFSENRCIFIEQTFDCGRLQFALLKNFIKRT